MWGHAHVLIVISINFALENASHEGNGGKHSWEESPYLRAQLQPSQLGQAIGMVYSSCATCGKCVPEDEIIRAVDFVEDYLNGSSFFSRGNTVEKFYIENVEDEDLLQGMFSSVVEGQLPGAVEKKERHGNLNMMKEYTVSGRVLIQLWREMKDFAVYVRKL